VIKSKIPLNREKQPWDKGSFEKFEIDPNLYTHLCIIEALQAIPKSVESGKIENGFMALSNAVHQLEQILKARNMLLEDEPEFEAEIEAEKKRLQDSGISDSLMLDAKIANFKLKKLLAKAFGVKAKAVEMVL